MKLERLLLGKKFANSESMYERVQILKRTTYTAFAGFLIILIAVAILFVSTIYLNSRTNSYLEEVIKPSNFQENITINLTTLSPDEKKIAMGLIRDLNPLYMENQKLILFDKDIMPYYNNTKYKSLYGFHKGGKNYIRYSNSEKRVRKTLCHELLHFHLFSNNLSHEVIGDLAEKGVCYEDY